jgi:hypothetical protein
MIDITKAIEEITERASWQLAPTIEPQSNAPLATVPGDAVITCAEFCGESLLRIDYQQRPLN